MSTRRPLSLNSVAQFTFSGLSVCLVMLECVSSDPLFMVYNNLSGPCRLVLFSSLVCKDQFKLVFIFVLLFILSLEFIERV